MIRFCWLVTHRSKPFLILYDINSMISTIWKWRGLIRPQISHLKTSWDDNCFIAGWVLGNLCEHEKSYILQEQMQHLDIYFHSLEDMNLPFMTSNKKSKIPTHFDLPSKHTHCFVIACVTRQSVVLSVHFSHFLLSRLPPSPSWRDSPWFWWSFWP